MLIAGVVALLLVCICVAVVGALVGGSFVFKLGPFAQSSPTPIALVASTSTPVVSPNTPNSPAAPNSPTAPVTVTPSAPNATPSPSSNWPVILSDNFATNANAWNISDTQPWTSDFGTVNESVGDGKLHLEANIVKAVGVKYWPKNLQAISDLSLTVEGKRVSGPESSARYGLFFRKDDNNNYYVFEVTDDQQFTVYVSYQGQSTSLIGWTNTDAVRPGQVNRLTATAVGSHFTFFVNNQQVGEVDDGQVKSGTAGVAFGMDANTEAVFEFNNFELRAP